MMHILTLLAEWVLIGAVCAVAFGVMVRRINQEEDEREQDEQS